MHWHGWFGHHTGRAYAPTAEGRRVHRGIQVFIHECNTQAALEPGRCCPLRLLVEDPKKNLLRCLEHRAKALSSDPGLAWMCVLEYMWGLGFGVWIREPSTAGGSGVLTVPVAQQTPNLWLKDLRLLSDVLRLARASEKRN